MKRIKAISITLALMLVFSLLPATAFAADDDASAKSGVEVTAETEQYNDFADDADGAVIKSLESAPIKAAASVITPVNLNSSADPEPIALSSQTAYLNMPCAGTLMLMFPENASTIKVDGNYPEYYNTKNGLSERYWYLGAGSHTVVATSSTNILALYAPATMNITATTTTKSYILGRPANSSTVSSFKVKAPGKGYIYLNMGDEISTNGLYYKTSGFSDFEYLTQSDAGRYVGVKSGTYTISVRSYTPLYGVNVKYKKVTEGKYGTKKSKAKKITRKKTRKGLIIANAKKVHWYKFKNTKLKKVTITVKAKINNGGNYGGLKVTVYDKRGTIGTNYVRPGQTLTVKPYTLGKGGKLVKGTYRIKVQSYQGGSGYFTVKWK